MESSCAVVGVCEAIAVVVDAVKAGGHCRWVVRHRRLKWIVERRPQMFDEPDSVSS